MQGEELTTADTGGDNATPPRSSGFSTVLLGGQQLVLAASGRDVRVLRKAAARSVAPNVDSKAGGVRAGYVEVQLLADVFPDAVGGVVSAVRWFGDRGGSCQGVQSGDGTALPSGECQSIPPLLCAARDALQAHACFLVWFPAV